MNKHDKEVYEYINSIEPCCQLCGSFRNLHRHHIRYGDHKRETYVGNTIVLCEKCHRRVHKNKKVWKKFLIVLDKQIRGDMD